MNDPKQINELPVNQACKAALLAAGEQPDQSVPHIFQLAQWGLQNLPPEAVDSPDVLLSLLSRLQISGKPRAMLEAFFPEESEIQDSESLVFNKTPERAASAVLDLLAAQAA
jgi:hypothetical protein